MIIGLSFPLPSNNTLPFVTCNLLSGQGAVPRLGVYLPRGGRCGLQPRSLKLFWGGTSTIDKSNENVKLRRKSIWRVSKIEALFFEPNISITEYHSNTYSCIE